MDPRVTSTKLADDALRLPTEMPAQAVQRIDRYVLVSEIASGGQASIYLGRLSGAAGFSRVVAIKRLHHRFTRDPEIVSMLMDEANIASRIRHANVASVIDVINTQEELLLVMEYVHGESLSHLLKAERRAGRSVPIGVAVRIILDCLYGLHAAHEARAEDGAPLHIVHRDVSPHNVLVGADGVSRIIDFGVAKATRRFQQTTDGSIKGKVAYMAAEQIAGETVDRRADIFGAGVILWEALTGRHLFQGESLEVTVGNVWRRDVVAPSAHRPEVPAGLDDVVLEALAFERAERFSTAKEMATALEPFDRASPSDVADWIQAVAGANLASLRSRVDQIEETSFEPSRSGPTPSIVADVVRRASEAQSSSEASTEPAGTAVNREGSPSDVTSRESAKPRRSRWSGRFMQAAILVVVAGAAALLARHTPSGTVEASRKHEPDTQITLSSDVVRSKAPAGAVRSERGSEGATSRPTRAPAKSTPDCSVPFRWDAARQVRVFREECSSKVQ